MKQNNLLVTLIVPIYNAERYLQFCLDSVISQTYNNLEIILVNDGSTDATKIICSAYAKKDSRIKVINKKNGGVSSARNIGLKNATGDYILFVDSDDFLAPTCVEKCLKIATSKEVDVVRFSYKKSLGCIKKTYRYATVSGCVIRKVDFDKKIFSKVFCNYDFTNIWSMMVDTSIAKKVSFENYVSGEDFLYSVRCMKEADTVYIIDEPLYEYKINWSSATHNYNIRKSIDELLVLNEISKIIKSRQGFNNRICSSIYADISNCAIAYDYNNYRKHLKYLFRGILSNKILDKIDQEEMFLSKGFYRKLRVRNFYKIMIRGRKQ